MNAKKLQMNLCALSTILLWSLANILVRVAVHYYSPVNLSFLRYLTASLVLLAYLVVSKMKLPKLSELPWFFLAGALGFSLYSFAFNTGSQYVPASVSGFVLGASPILTALFAGMFLGEKIGKIGWLAVLLAATGVGTITLPSGNLNVGWHVLWICLSSICISLYNVLQRKLLADGYQPMQITTYAIVAGTILLSVFAPSALAQLATAPPQQIVILLVLGIFCGAGAYGLWTIALSKADKTGEVSNYMFLTPIVTALFSVLFLHETPRPTVFIGGTLVLLSLVLMNTRNRFQKN